MFGFWFIVIMFLIIGVAGIFTTLFLIGCNRKPYPKQPEGDNNENSITPH